MRAVCMGECMVELREAQGGLYGRSFAGDAYNTAVYLKRSAPQLAVSFLTVTGDGALSAAMRAAWAEAGIESDLAHVAAGAEPGLYLITLDAAGERTFHYWRSASPARGWWAALRRAGGAEALAGADLVFLSGISLAILSAEDRAAAAGLITALRGRVGRIALDLNIRAALWRDADEARAALTPWLAVADIVRASRDDAAWLLGETAPGAQIAALRTAGVRELILTCDVQGCVLATALGETALPAPETTVRDTSGAGDAFNGAYLAARLAGVDPVQAAAAGLAVAARVVSWRGAVAPIDISHPRMM